MIKFLEGGLMNEWGWWKVLLAYFHTVFGHHVQYQSKIHCDCSIKGYEVKPVKNYYSKCTTNCTESIVETVNVRG